MMPIIITLMPMFAASAAKLEHSIIFVHENCELVL